MKMQNKLLGYFLRHPSETVTINGEFFDEKQYKIFKAIQNRQLNNQEISIPLIAKDAVVPDFELMAIYSEGLIQKATYLELLAEEQEKLEVAKTEEIIRHGLLTEGMTVKEKLDIFQTVKEKLNLASLTKRKYQIYENPDLINDWYEEYDKTKPISLKTGIGGIDKAIGGIGKTDFVTVVGDTNIGKTNLVLNIILNNLKEKKSVLFYSLEMSRGQIEDRLIAILGGHSAFRIRAREDNKMIFQSTVKEFSAFPLYIVDIGGITSNDIISDIINERSRHPIDLVVVDYLQRVNDSKDRNDNETQRIANIARKFKNTALNLGVPILSPVQVDKASHKSGKIEVENIADSKVIANETDLSLYIYTVDKKEDSKSIGSKIIKETFIKVVKSRHSEKDQIISISVDNFSLKMADDNIVEVLKYV